MVDGDVSYATPWLRLFDLTANPESADCFIFTGGADINPKLYGDENVWNLCQYYTARDNREVPFFHYAKTHDIPMIGICRGAQLITALTGGKLFHDVSGHNGGTHEVETHDGYLFKFSTYHHQMCRPTGKFRLLGWSPHLSDFYVTAQSYDNRQVDFVQGDPEIWWQEDAKALCIQGHPEWMDDDEPGVEYCRKLATSFILNS